MPQQKPGLESSPVQPDNAQDQKQRQRMLLAIAVLLVAVTVVLIRDWHFWFGTKEEPSDEETVAASSPSVNPRLRTSSSPPAPAKAKRATPKNPTEQIKEPPAVVATNRTPLPPLEVEVIAGDNRQIAQPRNNTVKVDMPSILANDKNPTNTPASSNQSQASMKAAERVQMSADTTRAVDRPVNPSYPLLAREMRVQGAVELQALIGIDGAIQDLRVLHGPAILASAAREAVRQWRFKPYLQHGQPVETEARITVNFTISTF